METFKQELIQMVIELVSEVISNKTYKSISIVTEPEVEAKPEKPKKEAKPKEEIKIEELHCPKCKTEILKRGNTAYGCANFKVCGFKIPFEILGKKLSDKHIVDLLSKGQTTKIKGLQKPGSETTSDAKLVMNGSFNIELG